MFPPLPEVRRGGCRSAGEYAAVGGSRKEPAIPQTKAQIRELLTAAGLHPNRRYGQHFLIDGNLMRRLVESAHVESADVVLEVGAGTGSLTEMLLDRAGHVVAVEIDKGLARLLGDRLHDHSNLTLLHTDVLASKHRVAPVVLETLTARAAARGGCFRLVANLPYSIATPLVVDLLLCELTMSSACFTVQREVAQRFVAGPGGADYGPVSVVVQSAGQVRRLANVPPEAFWPRPQVESVMLEVRPAQQPREELRWLGHVVHTGFAHRRKTLRYNLQAAFGKGVPGRLQHIAGLDFGARPEMIPVQQWQVVAAELQRSLPDGNDVLG
jgi:16S rRNA (adenine1518-N6/adenine1519-N6)-dimethyltransferase